MATAAAPSGTLATALARTRELFDHDPRLALEQTGQILRVHPGQPQALILRARAQAACGSLAEALATLRPVVEQHPQLPAGWRTLGALLLARGEEEGAAKAHANELRTSGRDPLLLDAAAALSRQDLPGAEQRLRTRLQDEPDDIAALRMLGELAGRLKRYADAEALLRHALAVAPSFAPARYGLAIALNRQHRTAEAVEEVERLLAAHPENESYRNLMGSLRAATGSYDAALAEFEAGLAMRPDRASLWMSYGHTLKTVGRTDESIAAYRQALAREPGRGEGWWSLANLKTLRFDAGDRAAMEAALGRTDLSNDDRLQLHFALGKAWEDEAEWRRSFDHYAEGNRLRKQTLDYDAQDTHDHVESLRALLTADFFAARAGQGAAAADPIFVVGMPRSGSTLIEQILASHPLVEGTRELSDLSVLGHRLAQRKVKSEPSRYAEQLAALTPEALRAAGEEYLDRTRVHRKAGKPFFIDKMPNNWAHVGLIRLILPNAKVIDTRRHPLACCFSNYKQHFARGQAFTYAFDDLGRYYRDYRAMMTHMEAVLPGYVHHVRHEEVVANTEAQVRALLDFCGLPFDQACLRFWETDRAVQTASSEQVRRPIFSEGLDQWRHYEPWLGGLKDALGDLAEPSKCRRV